MTLSRSQLAKARAIAAVLGPATRALAATWSWTVEGAEHWDAVRASGKQPILALWHGRILPATIYWQHKGIVAMTSQNFDGEWIARLMSRYGFRQARGSSSRGGVRALVQLRQELEAGHPVAFTVDGPRGPARVAQPGAVFLAGATGHPILPFHIEADRCWTLGSWDASMIPKPRSRVAIAIGEPMIVSATDDAILERGRCELERILGGLEACARQLVL